MAQTWAATRMNVEPIGPCVPTTSTLNPVSRTLWSCTGPATSVSGGSLVAFTSDLASKIFGGKIIANKRGSANALYSHEVEVSTGFDEALVYIKSFRRSTGKLLSSAVALNGQVLYLETLEMADVGVIS